MLDGQFLALVLVPLISLGLVGVVCLETLVTVIRSVRADASLVAQLTQHPGYTLVRCVEALIAVTGAGGVLLAGATLTTESMPAPVGVGLLLFAMGIGFLILVASIGRVLIEVYRHQCR